MDAFSPMLPAARTLRLPGVSIGRTSDTLRPRALTARTCGTACFLDSHSLSLRVNLASVGQHFRVAYSPNVRGATCFLNRRTVAQCRTLIPS